MRADLTAATFQFLNPPSRIRISDNNINGLVMSPTKDGQGFLYYSPLTSQKLFRLDTNAINNENNIENVDESIVEVGLKKSQTDGLAMDNLGRLYMQVLKIHLWFEIKTVPI